MSLYVDIEKRFKGFSLAVKIASNGAPLGILGASGSGKSMTLKCIAGIETPDSGQIVLNGRTLFDSRKKINVSPQMRNVGYLFQDYALFPHMTVAQNIGCAIRGKGAARQEKVEELLARFALEGLGGRYPRQLSGGQQQRAAVARILAYEPEVLLLDEPFSALDEHLKERLQIEMRDLIREYPGDVVMVTHSRDEVYRLSESLLILEGGRVVEMGAVGAVFAKPKHLLSARLTGCKNLSAAHRVGERMVFAEDWGCVFVAAAPVPAQLTHVGIRAHDFHPAVAGELNAVRIHIEKRVESPFEWNVLFRAADGGGEREGGTIWWKYAKASTLTEAPTHLAVDPEVVLLLTD